MKAVHQEEISSGVAALLLFVLFFGIIGMLMGHNIIRETIGGFLSSPTNDCGGDAKVFDGRSWSCP